MQRAMADALRSATPLASDTDASAAAETIARGNDRLTPSMQLDIYREQFWLRHLDILEDDFRSLAHRVGDDAFEALAKAYLQAFPPRSFTLRDLGRDLAQFVVATAPWSDDALVGELARVEWAFVEAFDAPDAPALDVASIASVPEDAWPSAHIVLQPSLQRLALRYAAHDYRRAVRSGDVPIAQPEATPSYVIVFRGASGLEHLELEVDAFRLLDELARGTPLGDACERVATSSGTPVARFEENVGAWFQRWTALGWISRVEL
jgi:hypothetical protein